MSKAFPTQKDKLIEDLDDEYGLDLSEDDFERLRKLTEPQLMLVARLLFKASRTEEPEER